MIHLDELIDRKNAERAVLVGVWNRKNPEEQVDDYLDELALLTETAGAKTLKVFKQRVERLHPSTFIGKGKLNRGRRRGLSNNGRILHR